MKGVKTLAITIGVVAAAMASGIAEAQPESIVIGMYAPAAPFKGTGERVSFLNSLATHLAGASNGKPVVGKVFSSASEFSAATKRGEIKFAVLDVPFASTLDGARVLASAVHGGATAAPWQILAAPRFELLTDLRGQPVAVPAVGVREGSFVANTLFRGEVDADYFGKIVVANDSGSALGMVKVGKASAAIVPTGTDESGLHRVLTLGSVGWPVFVAMASAQQTDVNAFSSRVVGFSASGTFTGFSNANNSVLRSVVLGRVDKRGPMTIPPPARFIARDLLKDRTVAIMQSNILDLIQPAEK